jgi:hypothetical protein
VTHKQNESEEEIADARRAQSILAWKQKGKGVNELKILSQL